MRCDRQVDVACGGEPRNCELLRALDARHLVQRDDVGMAGVTAIVNAMAVGLVIEVWRNGPVEDMHSSTRGPSDAAMFAESTDLHQHAVAALTADDRINGLLDFERHVLDRTRPWAGTRGRSLSELGRGFLGQYGKHVKDRINSLMALEEHSCVHDPLEVYLVSRARTFGRDHKGMPNWPTIVARVGLLLENPTHPAWYGDDRGAQAVADMPSAVQSIEQLTNALLINPFTLQVEVLEWLSRHLLFCAGPPYGPKWDAAN